MQTWIPHLGPQWEFCLREEFEVLFGGAAGPGKTDCLIMEATRDVFHPRYRGVLFRRTFPQLQEIIDRCHEWYPKIDKKAFYRAGEHRWFWPSGATVALSHMQHEDNKYDHQGKQYHFAGFDEVTQFTESQYTYVHSRVRSIYPEIKPRIRATTNPGGIGHVWCKKRFVDIGPSGTVFVDPKTKQSRVFISARLYDNPTLAEADPGYIHRLEALPLIERRRLIDGEWDAFEGQVFIELSKGTHGVEPFEIPHDWTRFMVFDWGYSRPWCALWFALDWDDNMYLYRAHLALREGSVDPDEGPRHSNDRICQEIKRLEPMDETLMYRVTDPACWSPTKLKGSNKAHGPSFVSDARRHDLFFRKADNDRIRGIQQVHARLAIPEIVNTETGEVEAESPKLFVFNNIDSWWTEFEDLRQDPKNPEDVDTDQPDEHYDCTRYAAMSRPMVPRKIVEEPEGTFKAEQIRHKRATQYASRHGVSYSVAYHLVNKRPTV